VSSSWAAYVSLFLLAVAGLFQLALAAGMPWGALAMGGRFPGRLPTGMRVAALLQLTVIGFFGAIVSVRAGFALAAWMPLARRLIWVVVAYSLLGAVLNLATPSQWERRVWAPVTLVLLASSLALALQ